jgi:putative glutamine amidotransferase
MKPVIGVSTDIVLYNTHRFHAVGQKYMLPLVANDLLPRPIPSFGPGSDVNDLLQGLNGLLLTGATSNIEPIHYGGGSDADCPPYDPSRDETTLPLIRAALERGLPLLCICRGHQELNVALGGSLFARVHEVPGRMDHRHPEGESHDVQYAPRHSVTLTPGGLLHSLARDKTVIEVNSLHGQAIDRLAEGLVIEALAPDGTIEAVRVREAKAFALGVQWHPEWLFAENEVSSALFAAFAEAARRTL